MIRSGQVASRGRSTRAYREGGEVGALDHRTAEKHLICVKKMQRSGTLSHLFAQGSVSARLLIENYQGYADETVTHLRRISPGAEFGQRQDWMVVYALASP
jgi:uncharacterized protein (TIGR04141 family)